MFVENGDKKDCLDIQMQYYIKDQHAKIKVTKRKSKIVFFIESVILPFDF